MRLCRQYILILSEDRAPKKRNFLVKIFQKVPKNAFFGLFFQNFACCPNNLAKIGTKTVLWESSKNQFGRPKKNVKIFKKFLKSAALEKILDPPLKTTPLLEPLDYNNLGLMKKDLLVEVVKSIKRDHFDRRGAKLVKMICVKDLKNVKNYTLLRQNLSVFGSLPK